MIKQMPPMKPQTYKQRKTATEEPPRNDSFYNLLMSILLTVDVYSTVG